MKQQHEIRDEVIEGVRVVREAYAARFNYDIDALFRHACEQVKKSKRKTVKLEPRRIDRVA